MIEKVNPSHPDKVADRITGAIVDLAYATEENPKIAVEVLIGHGVWHAIIEMTATLDKADICRAIHRIAGNVMCDVCITPQDRHLSDNQADGFRGLNHLAALHFGFCLHGLTSYLGHRKQLL